MHLVDIKYREHNEHIYVFITDRDYFIGCN